MAARVNFILAVELGGVLVLDGGFLSVRREEEDGCEKVGGLDGYISCVV